MSFFHRSKQTLSTTANHTPTKLAFALQDGHRQIFWYLIQFPCGGWREFDVRWLGVAQAEWLKGIPHELPKVAELIRDVNIFNLIRERDPQA
jgi:hypothetical protein